MQASRVRAFARSTRSKIPVLALLPLALFGFAVSCSSFETALAPVDAAVDAPVTDSADAAVDVGGNATDADATVVYMDGLNVNCAGWQASGSTSGLQTSKG